MTRVLVVGDVMLDRYWHGDVTRISPEAPVPVVKVTRVEDRLGGAANVAANVVALGGEAILVGIVGLDRNGDALEALAKDRGIYPSLVFLEGFDTSIKSRVLAQRQQMIRMDVEGDPSDAAVAAVGQSVQKALDRCDVVILSDYGKGALRDCQALIQMARKAGKPVLVDPKGTDWEKYRGATLIKPNLAELEAVIGEVSFGPVASLCGYLQVEAILVTSGGAGMTLYLDDDSIHQPADARAVFDVTGAGDTVIAAMAVALGRGQGWQDDMRFASAAAGIVVGKVGTATATAAEVSACMN
jgi:D-glycero-beta-D-manno-heptose-7-phosphate kinase